MLDTSPGEAGVKGHKLPVGVSMVPMFFVWAKGTGMSFLAGIAF